MNCKRIFSTTVRCIVYCLAGWHGAVASNPFSDSSPLPYGAPRFDRIVIADLEPALEEGIAAYEANIRAIRAVKPRKATFENVVCALAAADTILSRVRNISGYLRSNFASDSLTSILEAAAPRISALYDRTTFDRKIFRLVKTLYDKRFESGPDSLQIRTVEKVYRSYVRSGALLSPEAQQRLSRINAKLSVKRMRHGNNILRRTQSYLCFVSDSTELEGFRNRPAGNSPNAPGNWAGTINGPSA